MSRSAVAIDGPFEPDERINGEDVEAGDRVWACLFHGAPFRYRFRVAGTASRKRLPVATANTSARAPRLRRRRRDGRRCADCDVARAVRLRRSAGPGCRGSLPSRLSDPGRNRAAGPLRDHDHRRHRDRPLDHRCHRLVSRFAARPSRGHWDTVARTVPVARARNSRYRRRWAFSPKCLAGRLRGRGLRDALRLLRLGRWIEIEARLLVLAFEVAHRLLEIGLLELDPDEAPL